VVRTLLPAGLFALAAVAGCGDDGGGAGADAQPYVDALVDEMRDDDAPFEDDVAECIAAAMVDAVGVDQLEEAGVEPADLARADDFDEVDIDLDDRSTDQLAGALEECRAGEAFGEFLADSFAEEAGGELSAAARGCITDDIAGAGIEPVLAASMADEDAADGLELALLESVASCPGAMAELFTFGIEEQAGTTLSDEARACVAGFVEDNVEEAGRVFTEGGAGGQALGERIGVACAPTFGG
jgi:hypothetical protein